MQSLICSIQVENLEQAMTEIERLRKDGEKLQAELAGIVFASTFKLQWSLVSKKPITSMCLFLNTGVLKVIIVEQISYFPALCCANEVLSSSQLFPTNTL